MELTGQQIGRPGLFLDRDGVLNRDIEYASRPDQIIWMPGAAQAIRSANEAGYTVVVITNQSGVARGYFTEQDVRDLHQWMSGEVGQRGATINRFYYCPHLPDAAVPEYRIICDCRKPAPGLFRRAATELGIDVSRSVAIGDRERDLEAARGAGIPKRLLFTGGNLYDFLLRNQ